MYKKIFIFIFFALFLNAEETSSSLTRQKIEVQELKKQLNSFYNDKEKEYQTRKKELDSILSQIEKEKNQIKILHDQNLEILQSIKAEVEDKTSKIYNAMKPKDVALIFNQMIGEGKIDDVFDIILKLKENNVTQIMKYMSVSNASTLTQKLEHFNIESKKKDK